MTKQEFQKLGAEWTRKNAEYDRYIQELIDNPSGNYNSTNVGYFTKTQQELFDLETELLKIVSGEEVLED